MLALYSIFFFIALSQCSVIRLDEQRNKREAQFSANFQGSANAGTDAKFSLDTGGISGSMVGDLDYKGSGKGEGSLGLGPAKVSGTWGGDIEGNVKGGGEAHLHGLGDMGLKGDWEHQGQGQIGGKGTVDVYGMKVGGGAGTLKAQYEGTGSVVGGIGKGGLVGVEYDVQNKGVVAGEGGAGIGHPALGIGAGIHAEGTGEAVSQIKGDAGVGLGPNGLALQGKTHTDTKLGGELGLTGGVGEFNKYAEPKQWQ